MLFLECGFDEVPEERMWLVRLGFEFGMVLDCYEEGMILDLHHFDEVFVRIDT